MDKFKFLIDMVLENEGGYCKIKGDAGGETYCGIAKNSHPNWSGWKILNKYKPLKYNQIIENDDLKNAVYDVYKKDYYSPLKIDKIDDLMISAHLICHGVNAGNKAAAKLLQKSINNVFNCNISVDGIIGNQTLQYSNDKNNSINLSNEFIRQREIFYKNIVKNKPSQSKFLKGWINRINRTTSYVTSYFKESNDNKQTVLYTNVVKNNNKLISILEKIIKFIINLIKKC